MSVLIDCIITNKESKLLNILRTFISDQIEASGHLSFDIFGNLNEIYFEYTGDPITSYYSQYGDIMFHTHPQTHYNTDNPSAGDLTNNLKFPNEENIGNKRLILGPIKIIIYYPHNIEAWKYIHQQNIENDKRIPDDIQDKLYKLNEIIKEEYDKLLVLTNTMVSLPSFHENNPIITFLLQNLKSGRIKSKNFLIFKPSFWKMPKELAKYKAKDDIIVQKRKELIEKVLKIFPYSSEFVIDEYI